YNSLRRQLFFLGDRRSCAEENKYMAATPFAAGAELATSEQNFARNESARTPTAGSLRLIRAEQRSRLTRRPEAIADSPSVEKGSGIARQSVTGGSAQDRRRGPRTERSM